MTQEEMTFTKLTASAGHVLTQAADVEDAVRVYGTELILAAGDSAANWKEVSEAEMEAALAARGASEAEEGGE